MVELNINSALKVDNSNITEGNTGRIFYEKLDNTLGQVPGFIYDETTTTLSYEDSVRGLFFIVGETQIAPSVFVPTGSILNADNFGFGLVDLSSVGQGVNALVGDSAQSFIVDKGSGDNNIRAINNVNNSGVGNFYMDFEGDFDADFVGNFFIRNRPTYIDNADAIINGAPINSIYKTTSGELRIVV